MNRITLVLAFSSAALLSLVAITYEQEVAEKTFQVSEQDLPDADSKISLNSNNDALSPSIQGASTIIDTSELSEKQKLKYLNLDDEDRAEMLRLISEANAAKTALNQGAEKYIALRKDDKKFEALDAKADALIAELYKQTGTTRSDFEEQYPQSTSK